ncbi:MAG: glycine betaine ABC transporter substrate-binding protein, partial [Chloroflexota bacterium]
GQYNVIEIFTTDGPLRANHLVVLTDNKHAVFPADHIAPVIRDTVLHRYPRIQRILNKLAPYLTTPTMIKLNIKVVLQTKDPASVARSFLRSKHLI